METEKPSGGNSIRLRRSPIIGANINRRADEQSVKREAFANARSYPFSIGLAVFIVMFALLGCGVSYPSEKFRCGENGDCPRGLYCREADRKCVSRDRLNTSEDGSKTSSDSQTDAATDADQAESGHAAVTTAAAGGSGGVQRATSSGGNSGNVGKGGQGGQGGTARASGGAGGTNGEGGSGGSNRPTGFDCGEQTCVDRATGLEWLRCTLGQVVADCSGDASALTWQNAVDTCDRLNFAGHDDWRLPGIHELVSIVDYSKADPPIDSVSFPSTPVDGSWSSTSAVVMTTRAWGIRFSSGFLAYDDKTIDVQIPIIGSAISTRFTARCVRGEALKVGIFRDEIKEGTDLVVYDDANYLVWQGCSAGQSGSTCTGVAATYNWQDAQSYCEKLNYGGYKSGWRLPTHKELLSIVDYDVSLPAIDGTKFPGTPFSSMFWSSTPIANLDNRAWFVNFTDGSNVYQTNTGILTDTSSADTAKAYYVRCVRSTP